VSDQQRAVVPAARVQVTNTATNAVFAATTNESGSYIVPGLPVGIYEISAESEGFKKALRSGVTLQVNQIAQVDLTLEIGAVAEVVEVTGEAPLVSASDAIANRAAPLGLVQNDHATLPRPVLYMFGKDDTAFNDDSPTPEPGWHETQMSRSRRTLVELAKRNACTIPSGSFWTESKQFSPPSQFQHLGATVKWHLHDGDHGWPAAANDLVVQFFQGG